MLDLIGQAIGAIIVLWFLAAGIEVVFFRKKSEKKSLRAPHQLGEFDPDFPDSTKKP